MKKPGAEFVSPWHETSQVFQFSDAWDKSMPYAYQVRRSEFDEVLIRNAEAKGAAVHEECRVRDVEFGASGTMVRAEHQRRPQRKLAHALCNRRIRAGHVSRKPIQGQTSQSEAQQRRDLRPFFRSAAQPPAKRKATLRSIGSTTAGSGSSRC